VDPKGQPRADVFHPFTKDDYGGDTMSTDDPDN